MSAVELIGLIAILWFVCWLFDTGIRHLDYFLNRIRRRK